MTETLLEHNRAKSSLMGPDELDHFTTQKEFTRCGLCENNCALTVTIFNDGSKFVTGNRCERRAEKVTKIKFDRSNQKENLVDYKYKKLFKFKALAKRDAVHGIIGVPRVLNMYENYPLWHTILTDLGFRVQLSPKSDKKLFEKGIETIPSDTVCYPAKMVHGHIQSLIDRKVDAILYPSVIYEQIENSKAPNHYNCPIVQSYPEVIEKNMDPIRNGEVKYFHPFVNLADHESVVKSLIKAFSEYKDITAEDIQNAVEHGYQALADFKQDLQDKSDELLSTLALKSEKAIVLSGRPYHLDPEINHGIANIITQEGFHVLTEDMVAGLEEVSGLRVVNQWVYHSRLYAAAKVVSKNPNLELVQLNSFGCGLDAVTTDQVEEIMRGHNKLYTVLKIDEGSNLGAIRIRLRSLKAAVEERDKKFKKANLDHIFNQAPQFDSQFDEEEERKEPVFTKEMKKTHTLLMPMLSPIHQNGLIEEAFKHAGYNVVNLPAMDRKAVDVGLKFVHNDACYPAIISIGQLIEALQSGEYDLDNTSVMMTQTGGGCRATNYIPLLRKALKDAGFPQVPVVSISMGNQGTEETPGWSLTYSFVKRLLISVLYGDLFERVLYRVRPYEAVPGSANALYDKWLEIARKNVRSGSYFEFNHNMKRIIKEFDTLETVDFGQKPRVGVVGEILVKYAPTANNDIVAIIENEGGEAVVPDLIGFMNYSLFNQIWKADGLNMSQKAKHFAKLGIDAINLLEKPMNKVLEKSERFEGIESIYDIAEGASKIISIGNHTGEGWFLTGEMIELLNNDVKNIVCLQPFGCLPNHIVGKGMVKELRRQYKGANIAPIDYDPGSSEVNQLNRIRLMMTTAKKMQKATLTSAN
ncbi:acyl-CoA dehydratase activase-related protein [Streptococcus macedonicus]|uniref:acyl-CoA dehydratase activase-related protein n=1 Tax=Streptococcus macedonicus TaxID=59310 RepID=UPI00211EEFD8|nr:acyl-CoA dehydratase activase-related protein [Streptococcus macedonicus]